MQITNNSLLGWLLGHYNKFWTIKITLTFKDQDYSWKYCFNEAVIWYLKEI